MSDQAPAPAPAPAAAPTEWVAPDSDQDFIFESIDKAPAWVDKGWAGFDRGPALQLPAGDIYGTGPYWTKTAKVGDRVLFVAAKGSMPAHFEVVARDASADEGIGCKKPPQQSPVALEDALKTGWLTPEDLGEEGRGQVLARTPALKRLIEEGVNAPEPQSITNVVKID